MSSETPQILYRHARAALRELEAAQENVTEAERKLDSAVWTLYCEALEVKDPEYDSFGKIANALELTRARVQRIIEREREREGNELATTAVSRVGWR